MDICIGSLCWKVKVLLSFSFLKEAVPHLHVLFFVTCKMLLLYHTYFWALWPKRWTLFSSEPLVNLPEQISSSYVLGVFCQVFGDVEPASSIIYQKVMKKKSSASCWSFRGRCLILISTILEGMRQNLFSFSESSFAPVVLHTLHLIVRNVPD